MESNRLYVRPARPGRCSAYWEVKSQMLTPEQKTQLYATAQRVFAESRDHFKEAGAVLTETEGGYVRAEFIIGTETIPTLRFPKAQLADAKWAAATLRNLDGAITKAQIKAYIALAVAEMPL